MPVKRAVCSVGCKVACSLRLRALSVFAWGLVSGCDCSGGGGLSKVAPEIQVLPSSIDFEQVPLGARRRVAVEVRNLGTGDLSVSRVAVFPPFSVDGAVSSLAPGDSRVIDVVFAPETDERKESQVEIDSDDPNTPTVRVRVVGVGVAGILSVVPQEIDLLNTRVGTVEIREIALSNSGLDAREGRLVGEGFDRPEHFTLSSLLSLQEAGAFAVGALSQTIFDLSYRPLVEGEDRGRLLFEFCGDRCGLEVNVDASAALASVRLDPALLDFGAFAIGETRTRALLVQNTGSQPVRVTDVSTRGGAELEVAPAAPLPADVAPGGSFLLRVELTPSSSLPFRGEVVVSTSDPAVGDLVAEVLGEGQGPLFVVFPSTLAFGVERAAGTYVRSVLFLNSGSQDVLVMGAELSGDPAFSLANLPGLPARLGAGESITVDVVFTPTRIAGYAATLTVRSDDPGRAIITVPVTGGMADRLCEIGLSPERLNFGLLPPSFVRRQAVTLTNTGTDVCRLLSGSFRAPLEPAMTLTHDPLPLTLASGERVRLEFQFAPTVMAEAKASYVVLTDDPVFPERPVSLLGSSEGYVDIFTRPELIDFGEVRPGCTTPAREVRVFNAGSVAATVEAITLTSTRTQEVRFATRPVTQAALPSGGFVSLSAVYAPIDLGIDTTEIEVRVRDLPYAFIVPVRGQGADAPRSIETFRQADKELVDVLFVIDDSCSMFDDQQALAANFARFISQATVRQVDFHIGITTTTLEPIPGLLRGPVMTTATSNLESAFRSQAAVGAGGSGIERGLDAMRSALRLAAAGQPPNAALIRDEAGLVVVIVSDEDDQSFAPPLLYYNELRARPNAQLVSATITGGRTGCFRRDGSVAAPAPRYEEFKDLAGGVSELICNDWSSTLSSVGEAAFALRRTFTLSRAADTTMPIVVRINGRAVTPGSVTYEPDSRSIRFAEPPSEGSTITVEFTPSC